MERPLSWWVVAAYAVTAVGIGAAMVWWSWPPAFPAPTEAKDRISAVAEQTKAETEAIRTGLVAAGGAGAAFTLLLAVRRQRTTETMNQATQHDATERRVTELYTAAVEQLGHERAAVRLGGLYALQRLGQDHPDQRRAIVNVWCAYLRMPFADPDEEGLDADTRAVRRQETQVRTTVQDLLREHAHSGTIDDGPASSRFWGDDLTVDLTGATLHNLDLIRRRIHPSTDLTRSHFTGDAWFAGTTFTGDAKFSEAMFTGNALFVEATFTGDAKFHEATFTDNAFFIEATFTSSADFSEVTFTGDAWFGEATFTNNAWFAGTTFTADAKFHEATFTGDISFNNAKGRADGNQVWPAGWRLGSTDDPDGKTDEQGRRWLPLRKDPEPDPPETSPDPALSEDLE